MLGYNAIEEISNELVSKLVKEIVRTRTELGISQKMLEELSGVSQPVIARMESGQTIPQVSTIIKLLIPLGKTLAIVPLEQDSRRVNMAFKEFLDSIKSSFVKKNSIDFEQVWRNVETHAGEEFYTVKNISFTYTFKGNRISLNNTNRDIPRSDFERAFAVNPEKPMVLNKMNVQGPSYLFAIITDDRIIKSSDIDKIWERIALHAGETFFTTSMHRAFTYAFADDHIELTHSGNKTVNIYKSSFEKALAQKPNSVSDVSTVAGWPSYIFAILTDERIK